MFLALELLEINESRESKKSKQVEQKISLTYATVVNFAREWYSALSFRATASPSSDILPLSVAPAISVTGRSRSRVFICVFA